MHLYGHAGLEPSDEPLAHEGADPRGPYQADRNDGDPRGDHLPALGETRQDDPVRRRDQDQLIAD